MSSRASGKAALLPDRLTGEEPFVPGRGTRTCRRRAASSGTESSDPSPPVGGVVVTVVVARIGVLVVVVAADATGTEDDAEGRDHRGRRAQASVTTSPSQPHAAWWAASPRRGRVGFVLIALPV